MAQCFGDSRERIRYETFDARFPSASADATNVLDRRKLSQHGSAAGRIGPDDTVAMMMRREGHGKRTGVASSPHHPPTAEGGDEFAEYLRAARTHLCKLV